MIRKLINWFFSKPEPAPYSQYVTYIWGGGIGTETSLPLTTGSNDD